MMKNIIKLSSLALMMTLGAGSAVAGEAPETVIELFTSQGCSSCPPANEFVGKLSEDPDKLVLSYGVTYWDYLGWKDTFGDIEYTKRQKAYSKAMGIGHVYTPQIVLNGKDHNSRYRKRTVEQNPLARAKNVELDLTSEDGQLVLSSSAPKTLIVTYQPGWQTIPVARGENGGRTLQIANVVKNITWAKKSGVTDIEVEDGLAYAALVHDEDTNRILAASVVKADDAPPSRN